MVNLKLYNNVSEQLPDGLYYSKQQGLIIQSENGKLLYINPKNIKDIEEDLINNDGTLPSTLLSEGVLPEGLSYNPTTGIFSISTSDGNPGGLIIKDLMAITSKPIGEEDGTSGNMYLLKEENGYYTRKASSKKGETFGDIVISDIDSTLYSAYWGIQFKIVDTNEFAVISIGNNFKTNSSGLSSLNYKITGDYKDYNIIQIGDSMNPVTSIYWLLLQGGLLVYNTSTSNFLREIADHAFENTNVDFSGNPHGTNNIVYYEKIGDYAFSNWNPPSQWDDGKILLNYFNGTSQKAPSCVLGTGCFKNAQVTYFRLDESHGNQLFLVGVSCFEGCTKLTRFCDATKTINDPVAFPMQTISDRAFYGCTNLKEIYANGSVAENIGDYAFSNCNNLEAIYGLTSVEKIGKEAFYGLSSLKRVELADTLQEVGKDAFYGCTSLEYIGSSSPQIMKIKDGAFYNCSKLNIQIPDTVIEIGSRAFHKCTSLTEVNFSSNTKSIGTSAFEGCTNVTINNLPSHPEYTTVEEDTFFGCNVNIPEIPKNITEIGSGAFALGSGKILKTKGSSLTIRESGFSNFIFEEPVDAVSVTSCVFENSSFVGAKGELRLNASVYSQFIQSGRVLKDTNTGNYYIDSKDMIVKDGGEI